MWRNGQLVPRERGTYDVVGALWLGSVEACEYLEKRFAMRSQRLGTVELVKFEVEHVSQHDHNVTIRYRHTCRNKGNASSDFRRFVRTAMNGRSYRWELRAPIRVRPWKEAA